MPLVANTGLPTFDRLKREGALIIPEGFALQQDIRELHIGLLNMMPDAALAATERQFLRLIGESNEIAQFYVHPFTLDALPRGPEAAEHIARFYEGFEQIRASGLDGLIITGANVTQPDLAAESFWNPLITVIDWALKHVTSVLCSCLATHAIVEFRYHQRRHPLRHKQWGVYPHNVLDRFHPLTNNINTRFDVPHSRLNQIDREQFEAANLHVLAESPEAGVHLAVSEDRFRIVFLQGHPEYDTVSLLKEYKREIVRFLKTARPDYPRFPDGYLTPTQQAILDEYHDRVIAAQEAGNSTPPFPESLIAEGLHNTWRDTAKAVISNWIGNVYQLTSMDRRQPFRQGIDPNDPLSLRL